MTVKDLYRYPVKGLSGERLEQVTLRAEYGFPVDRTFALARPGTVFDPADPKPAPKSKFLMLMKDERLASLSTRYDEISGTFSITDRDGIVRLQTSLTHADGVAEVEAFFFDFLGDVLDAPPQLVRADGHQFTDVSVFSKSMMHAVSLINLASIRSLESAIGKTVHPLRFRANIYYDDDQPWSEFDLIGKTLKIGEVAAEVVLRTRRCPATQVNPGNAERDLDVPSFLKIHFGHSDLGVYAEVRTGGVIKTCDPLTIL